MNRSAAARRIVNGVVVERVDGLADVLGATVGVAAPALRRRPSRSDGLMARGSRIDSSRRAARS